MEDYALRRKEYVQQVRASFDQSNDALEPGLVDNITTEYSSFFGLKIRSVIAIIIFLAYLFCKYNSYPIFGYTTTEIIDIITDNQYYTFLQNYDILNKIGF